MDIRHAEVFLTLARIRHFGRTANILNMTQPNVSRLIHQLEDEFGTTLFKRCHRDVTLTPAGEAFLPYAEAVLTQLQKGKEAVVNASLTTRTIKIGITRSPLVRHYLAQRMKIVARRFPQATFVIKTDETIPIHRGVQEGNIDFGICCFSSSTDTVISERLFTHQLALMAPRRFLSRIHSPRDLSNVPWVQYCSEMGYRRVVESFWNKYDCLPHVVAEGTSTSIVTSLIIAGLGCGLLPVGEGHQFSELEFAYQIHLPQIKDLSHDYFLVYRLSRGDSLINNVLQSLKVGVT